MTVAICIILAIAGTVMLVSRNSLIKMLAWPLIVLAILLAVSVYLDIVIQESLYEYSKGLKELP